MYRKCFGKARKMLTSPLQNTFSIAKKSRRNKSLQMERQVLYLSKLHKHKNNYYYTAIVVLRFH